MVALLKILQKVLQHVLVPERYPAYNHRIFISANQRIVTAMQTQTLVDVIQRAQLRKGKWAHDRGTTYGLVIYRFYKLLFKWLG